MFRNLTFSFLALLTTCSAPTVRIVRFDPRADRLIPADAAVERLTDGHAWLEGPAWNPKGRFLLFSDIPKNAVYRWKESEGTSLFLSPSGYSGARPFAGREPGSNGLVFDRDGRLILCEHGDRRLTRIEQDGRRYVIADRFEGKRLNSPNDVIVSKAGDLYFTDPPFGLPAAFADTARDLDFCGVYRWTEENGITLLTRDLVAPNGIALSPDEKTLYVTDVHPPSAGWYAFDVMSDGTIGNRRLLKDARPWMASRPGGPDGLDVDVHGNLFAAGPGGIYVLAPDGSELAFIDFGVATANCTWGDDGSTLYITAGTAVYRVRTITRGSHIQFF